MLDSILAVHWPFQTTWDLQGKKGLALIKNRCKFTTVSRNPRVRRYCRQRDDDIVAYAFVYAIIHGFFLRLTVIETRIYILDSGGGGQRVKCTLWCVFRTCNGAV